MASQGAFFITPKEEAKRKKQEDLKNKEPEVPMLLFPPAKEKGSRGNY